MISTYLKLWTRDGEFALVEAGREPSVDAAVTRWAESGNTRDSVLKLELMDGDVYAVLASHITCWIVSTAEGRRRAIEWERDSREEHNQMRMEAGIFDGDE